MVRRFMIGGVVLFLLATLGVGYHRAKSGTGFPEFGKQESNRPAAACVPRVPKRDTTKVDPGVQEKTKAAVQWTLDQQTFPGAILMVGRGDTLAVEQSFGQLTWQSAQQPDAAQTVYDLASVTKVVAATAAAMLLYEDSKLKLDQTLGEFLPEVQGTDKAPITVRQLLTHTSGFLPQAATGSTPEEALAGMLKRPLEKPAKFRYTNVNMVVLWTAMTKIAGQPVEELLRKRVFWPLGMCATGFKPQQPCQVCAPAEPQLVGVVHDEMTRKLGGVSGCAGLFSTGHNLSRFAAMIASGGQLNGKRIFRPETIRLFGTPQFESGAPDWGLGWQVWSDAPALAHTGFTGTSLWADPVTGGWVVILSNRTYEPKQAESVQLFNLNHLRHATARWVRQNAVT